MLLFGHPTPSGAYTYKGSFYCEGSRSQFSGSFDTLKSCQESCLGLSDCHTLNYYAGGGCYWCPATGWTSESSSTGVMYEKEPGVSWYSGTGSPTWGPTRAASGAPCEWVCKDASDAMVLRLSQGEFRSCDRLKRAGLCLFSRGAAALPPL